MTYTPWRDVAAQHGVYAAAGWMPEDIETLRPDWTNERCLQFLKDNEKYITEAMVRDGWGAIEALLPTEKEESDE
jgi:hypothetical protein